jgi:hypothetical protein
VFPLWWSDVPAILKGWFDRVWTKGFAYSPSGDIELRRLSPRRALALCTSGHPVDKLERDGVIIGLRSILLGDRLINVGYRRAELVILGGLTTAADCATPRTARRGLSPRARLLSPVAGNRSPLAVDSSAPGASRGARHSPDGEDRPREVAPSGIFSPIAEQARGVVSGD